MAFTAIPADGAVGFGFLVEARQAAGVQTLFLASGEHLIAPASIKLNLGFIAYHYRKSDRPIAAIHGVIDLAPYVVEWAANFSDQQADAMEGALAQLERKTLQPWASGLWTLGSGVACGTNLGNLEAAAIRGDRCVRAINNTLFEVTEIGRTINLPATVAYETGVVQSACTGLARAFGWKNDRLRATQAGINSWLQADLRFQPA
ncbi:MAG: hypothetical protein LW834_21845 [Cyanobium sp. 49614_E6]|nr:hypothetical protein [Cyanobium sp. 49614_E6]